MLIIGKLNAITFIMMVSQAYGQTVSNDPSTEAGQANRLLGLPFWIIVVVIVLVVLLFTFGSRRGGRHN